MTSFCSTTQPAYFCAEQIITNYCIHLNPLQPSKENEISLCIDNNITEIILGPDNGVKENVLYFYSITAANNIGIRSSITKNLCKFALSITVVRENFGVKNISDRVVVSEN